MDKSTGNNKSGSTLSRADLASFQADMIWMHNRTIRELEEAKAKDAREAELKAKQAQQPRK